MPAQAHALPRSTPARVSGGGASGEERIPACYVFAGCLLDTQLYALYRAGVPVPLRPKAFHVLRYLVEHRHHLVTKDELGAHVWPAEFVSDATIEGCVKQVRQAIGDTGRAQRLIQTRRGYGYRFVGDLETPAPIERESATTSARAPHPATPVARAASTAGSPGGERKLVTLLGCTPAHATVHGAPGGLDALHDQMRTLHAVAQQEVQRLGGTIHSVAGTRLLAIFGAPVAQEDHARRALLAAWGVQQRLAAGSRDRLGEPVTACLGLHTGVVVMGGIEEAPGSAIVGDLPLAVEALQDRGVPGALLCSEATARLIRRDAYLDEEAGPVPVAGQPSAMRTYRVTGLRSRDASGMLLRALTPFVGRTHELGMLRATLAHVVDGRGQTVGIVGEPAPPP